MERVIFSLTLFAHINLFLLYHCSYTCPECRSPGAPGGHVCLHRKLLQYIHDIGSSGYIHVRKLIRQDERLKFKLKNLNYLHDEDKSKIGKIIFF